MSDLPADLLLRNIREVFSERDDARRLEAIRTIYAPDATLFEREGRLDGYQAISDKVSALLKRFPADFVFTPISVPALNHDLGQVRWQLAPTGGAAVGTGLDVARFEGGRIKALYVFLDEKTKPA